VISGRGSHCRSLGQAARRTSLWIVVGLRFSVMAIALILARSARRVATCLVSL
jgi:hypothetical protein